MSINSPQLRLAMRHWTTGVTIVSVSYQGVQHGMTVSSFTSVSLTPPTILISLEKTTRTHRLLTKAGFFGVTILNTSQEEISERFAGRNTEDQDRFKGLRFHTIITGAPFLEGGLSFIDCRVIGSYPVNTHTLFIGEVLAVEIGQDGEPLVHFNRRYRKLQE